MRRFMNTQEKFTAFTAETFGGPDRFTKEMGGFNHSHVDFGSHVAKQNSNARTNDELHPLHEVPKWTWSAGFPTFRSTAPPCL